MAESKKIVVKVNCASSLSTQSEPVELQDNIVEWRVDRIMGALAIFLVFIILSVVGVKNYWLEKPSQVQEHLSAPAVINNQVQQAEASQDTPQKLVIVPPVIKQPVSITKPDQLPEKPIIAAKKVVSKITAKKKSKLKFKHHTQKK